MSDPTHEWQIQVRRAPDGSPVGAGLLLSERRILTCAHVAAAGNTTTAPDHVFVSSRQDPSTVVRARIHGWVPVEEDATGDLALLAVEGDSAIGGRPAPLLTAAGSEGHRFRAYGYPRGHERGGVWSTGVVVGAAEIEWLQLQADSPLGYGLEAGFSGSPVWDDLRQGVVGITVSRDRPGTHDRRTGFAIPTDVARRHFPRDVVLDDASADRPARRDPAHVRELLAARLRNVELLEKQAARYGIAVPTHVVIQLEDEATEVERLRAELASGPGGSS